jgi:hypothetical protein
VPEDRFRDLGEPQRPDDERSAAEKLAELDRTRPEPEPKPPDPPRPGGRYTWVVGVAALIVIVIGGINLARTGSGAGLKGPPVGQQLPEFAAPLVGGPDKDANIVPSDADTDDPKACEVRVPGSLNICDQWDRPVVMGFLFRRGADCEPSFDSLERLRREFPAVRFIGVLFERDRDAVKDVASKNDWNFPIVVDRDGAVVNLYAVGGCPTTVLADRGGKVRETIVGEVTEQELRRRVGRLVR